MLPPLFGSDPNSDIMQASNIDYPQAYQQQFLDQSSSLDYSVNGDAVMMPFQTGQLLNQQAQQMQRIQGGSATTISQPELLHMQQQGKSIPVVNPLGFIGKSVPNNSLQKMMQPSPQQQSFQQQQQQIPLVSNYVGVQSTQAPMADSLRRTTTNTQTQSV
jgi:hypothetical protein